MVSIIYMNRFKDKDSLFVQLENVNMKWYLIILMFLVVSACAPQSSAAPLIPPETLAAQTLAALVPSAQAAATLAPTNTATPTSIADVVRSAVGSGCIPPNAIIKTARVTNVINGDTIEVAMENTTYLVKYIGVDAPNLLNNPEPLGPDSLGINQKLVEGKVVTLVSDKTAMTSDAILPRYVFVNTTFVNYEMISHGFAKAVSEPPNISCDMTFAGAQANAQAALLGVWAPTPLPTATSTFVPTDTPIPSPTLVPVCNCRAELTCKNFKTQASAQACLNYCTAIDQLQHLFIDKNKNGIACEGLN